MITSTIFCADLFSGAGGATTAVTQAAKHLGLNVHLVAVNHWQIAVDTHSANYPHFVHYCQMVGKVSPREAVPGGYLDLLVAGPECTNHSNAKGGKPRDNQSRCSAFDIIWWLTDLDVRNVLIENVREWKDWGPMRQKVSADGVPMLDKDGNPWLEPIPERKGEYFDLFLDTLRRLGYELEYRVVCAADYGDATTRRRLFLIAWKGGESPMWPTPTHRPRKEVHHFPGAKPWRPVRDVLDFTLPTKSIYERAPGDELADNTMRRIYTGFVKYSGLPFIVPQFRDAGPLSMDDALGTITTTSRGVMFAQPCLIPNFGERETQTPRTHSIDDPSPAITSHGAGMLSEAWLLVARNNGDGASVDEPVPAICASGNHFWVAESYVMTNRTNNLATSLDVPMPTQCTGNNLFLVHPRFLINMKGKSTASDVEEPSPTQTTSAHQYLGESHLVQIGHTTEGHERRCYPLDRPMPTATRSGDFALSESRLDTFLAGFTQTGSNGTAVRSTLEPGPTFTTKQEHLVCEPCIVGAGGPIGSGRPQPCSEPLGTVLAENHRTLVASHVYKANNTGSGKPNSGSSLDEPCPTVMASWNNLGLVEPEPILIRYNEGDERTQSVADPLSTIDTSNRFALAQFVVQYNSAGENVWSVTEPLKTVTTRDRFALVELVVVPGAPEGLYQGCVVAWIDIRTRMLEPKELSGAHSFPDDYIFTGTKKAKVAQIGNSWPVSTGAALAFVLLARRNGRGKTKGWKTASTAFRIDLAEAIALMNISEKETWPTLWDLAGDELVLGGTSRRKTRRVSSARRTNV